MIDQRAVMVGGRLEKMGQVWRRVRPYLNGLLVVLLVAGAIWALIYVPKMQVPACPPGKEGLPPKICFDIENEARKTLAQILGGILAIIGIYMGFRRIRAAERQVLVAQEGQITERFTRAIEQLGKPEMSIRLGGIYALERIANDSDKDYWTIMETLTAFVRENAPWRGEPPSELPEKEAEAPKIAGPPTDIQAILTVLGRRKYQYGHKEEKGPLDLTETNLRKADFRGAHLEGAWLGYAHLESANLKGAHLEGAWLVGTHLEVAKLAEAHLEGALLYDAHFWMADLKGAHLGGAYLEEAHLEGADLKGAHLEGADLSRTLSLARKQLAEAILDDKTISPLLFREKRPEDKGPEENSQE